MTTIITFPARSNFFISELAKLADKDMSGHKLKLSTLNVPHSPTKTHVSGTIIAPTGGTARTLHKVINHEEYAPEALAGLKHNVTSITPILDIEVDTEVDEVIFVIGEVES